MKFLILVVWLVFMDFYSDFIWSKAVAATKVAVTKAWFFLSNCILHFFFQSVSSEQKVNALSASFVHSPVGENVDWRLSATISPCHVTVIL